MYLPPLFTHALWLFTIKCCSTVSTRFFSNAFGKNNPLLLLVFSVGLVSSSKASIWYVDSNSTCTSSCGSNWASAFQDLQEALDAAQSGDSIFVAKGTYFPTKNKQGQLSSGRDRTFRLVDGVYTFGGFSGATQTHPDDRDIASNPTILNGDVGITQDSSDNCYHVVYSSHALNLLFDGFTVQYGFIDTSTTDLGGAGMVNDTSVIEIKNCTFRNNNAYDKTGGGLLNLSGSPIVRNCHFENNHALGPNSWVARGGGLTHLYAMNGYVYNSTFTGNSCSWQGGGASFGFGAPTQLVNCTFTGNHSGSQGGGLMFLSSHVHPWDFVAKATNCVFQNNTAPKGAGAFVGQTRGQFIDCKFIDNVASDRGGGLEILQSWASSYPDRHTWIDRCVFENNQAEQTGGGGIFVVDTSYALITNSLFYANKTLANGINSVNGGALLIDKNSSLADIVNCTFYANTAVGGTGGNQGYGGAVACTTEGSAAVSNSLFWSNTADQHNEVWFANNGSLNYSLTESFNPGGSVGNVVGSYPLFYDTISLIGADSIWATADDGLNLKFNSPAVSKGRNDSVPSVVTTDIKGFSRIYPITVDMGAYESDNCPPGDTIYVKWDATGANNGTCWKDAYTSLNVAVANATFGQQIWVAKGTYYATLNGNYGTPTNPWDAQIRIKQAIELYGGFDGNETLRTDRDSIDNQTIISGDIGVAGDHTDNTYITMAFVGLTNGIPIIDGFTFKHGSDDKTPHYAFRGGGAIYTYSSNPLIRNCTFEDNHYVRPSVTSPTYGGAIYINGGSPEFINCRFRNNTSNQGGAIAVATYTQGSGASLLVDKANPVFTSCLFEDNHALEGAGGAILFLSSGVSVEFSDCTFRDNSAKTNGGALSLGEHMRGTLENTYFYRNYAHEYGGAIEVDGKNYFDESRPTINTCVFDSNHADLGGGAIYSWNAGEPEVLNSIFYRNRSADGGAVFNMGGSPDYVNNTFVANRADSLGGGAIINVDETFTVINNCIFAANEVGSGATGEDVLNVGTTYQGNSVTAAKSALTHCLTQSYGIAGGEGNLVGVAPHFVDSLNPIGNDGKWHSPDDGLKLKSTSPAINSGNAIFYPHSLEQDFANATRVQKGAIDMGAYENSNGVAPQLWPNPTSSLQAVMGCPNLPTDTVSIKTDFGAVGDNVTNDTEAFIKAAIYLDSMSNDSVRTILKIDAGTYLVGMQLDSMTTHTVTEPITGLSRTYINDGSNGGLIRMKMGLDLVSLTSSQNVTIYGENGAKLIFEDSLHYGGYDTNMVPLYVNANSPPSHYHSASVGTMFHFLNCDCIELRDLQLDGNEETVKLGGIHGGHSGDGYQLSHDGVLIFNARKISLDNVITSRFGRDGTMVIETPYAPKYTRNVFFRNITAEYNGRQGLSWVGGDSLRVLNCSFSYTGRGHVHNIPGACVDIEPELARCTNGFFKSCELLQPKGNPMISDWSYEGWRSSNINFEDCTFWGYESHAVRARQMRNTTFKNCDIYGTVSFLSGTGYNDYITIDSCYLSDVGPDGKPVINSVNNQTIILQGGNGQTPISYNQFVLAPGDTTYYYDWDNVANFYFEVRNSRFDVHRSLAFYYNAGYDGDEAFGPMIHRLPIGRRFSCNQFNFYTSSLLDFSTPLQCQQTARLVGRLFNAEMISNTFVDVNPIEPGVNNINMQPGCDKRVSFLLSLDKDNISDGNNVVSPTTPSAQWIFDPNLPHSRLTRFISVQNTFSNYSDF